MKRTNEEHIQEPATIKLSIVLTANSEAIARLKAMLEIAIEDALEVLNNEVKSEFGITSYQQMHSVIAQSGANSLYTLEAANLNQKQSLA